MKSWIITSSLALALLAGCVKEERGECPCFLTLDLDAVIERGDFREAVSTLTPTFRGETDRNLISLSGYDDSSFEKMVMKDLVRISVVCGQKNAIFSEDCIKIAEDSQADPIMAYAESLLCDSESAVAKVELHKQYCCIRFIREGENSWEDCYFRCRVAAECSGMNLYDLTPVNGAFLADAVIGEDGIQTLLLPRQKKNALRLDILNLDGDVIHVVDLGAAFARIGYDWQKKDLDDINIKIDYAKAVFEIGIMEWENNYETIDI